MAGFEHGSAQPQETESTTHRARNAEYGLRLFIVYFAVYAGFVALNAFRPDLMERTPLAGINLAVLYGFSLILGALVMSLLYGWLCYTPATDEERKGDSA